MRDNQMKTGIRYILLSVLICVFIAPVRAVQYTLKTDKFQSVNTMVTRKQQTYKSYEQSYVRFEPSGNLSFGTKLVGNSNQALYKGSDAVSHSTGGYGAYYSAPAYNGYDGTTKIGRTHRFSVPQAVGFSTISRQNLVYQQVAFVEKNNADVLRHVERPGEDDEQIGYLEPVGDCPLWLMLLLIACFAFYKSIEKCKNRLLKD